MIGPNSAKRLILKTLVLGAWSSLVQCVRRGGQMGCYKLGCYGGCRNAEILAGSVVIGKAPL